MKSPAFQFYPDDFMGGKPGLMTPEETHVYVWLLCLDWNHGPFAFDETTLARWCRVPPRVIRRAWPAVRACFTETDGLYHNERLEKERAKQAEWRAKSSAGGKKSADVRGKGGSTTVPRVVEECLQPESNIPFPTPLPTKSIKSTKGASSRKRGESAPWMGEVRAVWGEVFPQSAGPTKGVADALRSLVAKQGIDVILPELRRYLTSFSDPKLMSLPKWASTFGGVDPEAKANAPTSYAAKWIRFAIDQGFTAVIPIEQHDARIDELAAQGVIKNAERMKAEMRAVAPWMTLKGMRAGESERYEERVAKLLQTATQAAA